MHSSPSRKAMSLASVSLAAALVLAGCSSDTQDTASANGGGSEATHSVEHARGTAEVPESPQRVVVLEPVELDTAVALDVTPVGASVASNIKGVPDYLGVDGVEPVGTVPEPDLEAIAELQPDLILGTESRHSELYEQLDSIAPTVFIESHATPWQENVVLIADALGKSDEVEGLLDDYTERCEEIKQEYDVEGTTANMVRPRDETRLSIYGPDSFAGHALECVGFTIPEQDFADGVSEDISPENILEAKADHVFVTTSDVTDQSTVPDAITQNAAEFPSVTLVDTSYWVSGVGPQGSELVLNDIEEFLQSQQ